MLYKLAKSIIRKTELRLIALNHDIVTIRAKRLSKRWVFDDLIKINCSNKPLPDDELTDIVTVAFNNVDVISNQIRLIRKNLIGKYHYTVADNSPDPVKQELIFQLCKDNGIAYFRLPNVPYFGMTPNLSHGLALSWIYNNYILKRQAKYFGFIDHDIFPIRPTDIIKQFQGSKVFGLIQERERIWYLWAGFCFFDFSFVKDKKVDFMPVRGGVGDTGAANWKSVYSYLDKASIPLIKHEYGRLREGDDPQSDWYEHIGDWLHTFNASNWKKVKDKNSLVNELLKPYF